ncbi:MAG: hypothetical protein QXQ90_06655 [Desulfurococcaceae archaeon]
MSSKDKYRELKLRKRIHAKLHEVFAELQRSVQGSAQGCKAIALEALRYTLPETRKLLERISKLKGPRDRCPSGILLNVPLATPLTVLRRLTLKRYYEIHDADAGVYYYFVCFDDVGRAFQLDSLPNVWLRGIAAKPQLENLVASFSLVLARLVKTNKKVTFAKRMRLATEIEKAVWSVLSKWAEEEGGGVAEK